MLKKLFLNRFGIAALAGISVFLSFPRFEIFILIFLFPGLTVALSRRCNSFKAAFGWGFLVSLIIMLGGFYWVVYVIHEFGYLPWAVSFLLYLGFCGFGALNFPLFQTACHWTENKLCTGKLNRPWLELWYAVGLPAIFTIVEFSVPKLFPWLIGHSLYKAVWLTQIVELTGCTFLSFTIFSTGVVAYLPLLQRVTGYNKPHPAIWLMPITLWILILSFSWARLSTPLPERVMTVALVQANIGSLEKVEAKMGFIDRVRHVLQTYERLTERALIGSKKVDLVVWPETAMPFTMQTISNSYSRELRAKVEQWNVPLVTGGYAVSQTDLTRDRNSAYLLDPIGEGKIHQEIYDKNILLAFGEYMPLGETFPFLYRWFPQVANFERGKTQNALTLKDGTRLGITICYEAIVPSFFRKVASNNVNLVLNITNDSWFGPTHEPFLHGALSVFRSIETRLPLVRVTNTGISFTVDLHGRMSQHTGLFNEDLLVSEVHVPTHTSPTIYTMYGDWFILLLVIIAACLMIIVIRKKIHEPISI